MSKRHSNALFIQEGACNLAAIARTLVEAVDEARAEGVQPSEDAAVRLIVHQMAFLANVGESTSFGDWDASMKQCEDLTKGGTA